MASFARTFKAPGSPGTPKDRPCNFVPHPVATSRGYTKSLLDTRRTRTTTESPVPNAKTPLQRFNHKWRLNEAGCWIWTASTNLRYPQFKSDGEKHLAHRWAYAKLIGEIPGDLMVTRTCGEKLCVNPEHLELATQSECNARGKNGWRWNGKCRSGNHEVSPEQTRVLPDGSRICRFCQRERKRRPN